MSDKRPQYWRSSTDDDVFTSVIATSIRMLNEMPDPYPMFGDMLRFFACIDFSGEEKVLKQVVSNYLIAKLKSGGKY